MFVQCSNNDNYGSNNVQTSNLLPPLSRPLNGNDSIYSSTLTLSRSGKVPPPPPVRRTSSISDPNAITLGTLRRAGVSTYEEIKTLKRNLERSNSNLYEELVPRKVRLLKCGQLKIIIHSRYTFVDFRKLSNSQNRLFEPFLEANQIVLQGDGECYSEYNLN